MGMPLPGTGRASAVWRTERGRGEPPTLHGPHTPVIRSVTRAYATRMTGLLTERMKPLVRGRFVVADTVRRGILRATVAYGVYSSIGPLTAYTLA